MSQTLYEEAIAEARRLTEMAEQNAKNKIIEAVTPQIRMLIERELMADADEMEEADEVDEMEDEAVGDVEATDVATLDLDALTPAAHGSAAAPGASVKMTDGTVEVNVDGVKIEVEPSVSHDEEVLLDQTVSETLARLMTGGKKRNRIHERVNKLRINVAFLKKAVNEAKAIGSDDQKRAVANIFETLAREAVTLQNQVILTHENTGGRTLETKIVSSIIKEMKDMSRRNNKNVFDFLFEAEEGEDMGTTADAAGGADAGAVEDAVKSLLKAAGIDMDVEVSSAGGEEAAEAGEEEAEETEEVAEADEMAHDESYEADEAMMHEADEEEEDEKAMKEADDETSKKDEVYEIDESALRAELRRLRGLNEADAVEGSGATSFGGGKAGDDMFVDVDEESLLNALADELGTAKMPKVGKMKESTEVEALRRQVQDYKSVAEQLKKQLVEMNLFNAKLLYANKLMQNREITAKQQRAIVEALDNAKTLREAKLLYKSLTTSLNKAANKGNLAEGRDLRTLGSASKSARSAQPAPAAINESGSMDRWALLAGIKKD